MSATMSATSTTTTTTPALSLAADANLPVQQSIQLIRGIHVLPTFTDKYAERQWAKEHMAAAFRVFAKMGFNDGAGGHISLRDPVDPRSFWINPYGVHFGLIRASDLVHVSEEGVPLAPTPHKVNTAGFMIHAALHKARPDIHAACHTHSRFGRAWSAFGKPVEMLNQDSCYFYKDLSVYEGFGGIVLAREEGERLAQNLGPTNHSIILQNHGILTCGGTVDEAATLFIALEQACEAQLLAEAAAANGLPKKIIPDEEAHYTKVNCTPALVYTQFKPEYDLIVKETGGDFLL